MGLFPLEFGRELQFVRCGLSRQFTVQCSLCENERILITPLHKLNARQERVTSSPLSNRLQALWKTPLKNSRPIIAKIIIANSTSRPIWSSGAIAFSIDLSTTCKPAKLKNKSIHCKKTQYVAYFNNDSVDLIRPKFNRCSLFIIHFITAVIINYLIFLSYMFIISPIHYQIQKQKRWKINTAWEENYRVRWMMDCFE